MMRHIHLYLDEDDWNSIQNELAKRWRTRPEATGESNTAGALLAEACRDLDEYRAMFGAAQRGEQQ